MKESLLKRLLVTIASILIGTFIAAQIAGYFIIKDLFLREQLKELTPHMQKVADEIKISDGGITLKDDIKLIMKAYDLNKNELPIKNSIPRNEKLFSEEDIRTDLLPYMDEIFKEEDKVTVIENLNHITGKSIVIGFPIRKDGNIIGAIFAVKMASDFSVIVNGFYSVFLITSLVSTIVIMMLIYYFTRKLIKPLIEMASVSNSMAAGNFSVRAKETGYGEVKELSSSLNNLAQRLFENDKSARLLEQTRRDYIANVSHELRTPISSIRAIAETLCDDIEIEEDKKQKYNLIILRESKRLQKLINDMLELSRLQSGEMSISKEMVDGRNLISEIGEYFEVFAEDSDAEFILTETAINIPDFYSNESRITQVLFILLDNAFKFTREDGGYVKLDASWDEEIIKISVQNNGEPIAPEDIDFVFERFYKADKAHNESGSGLGLSLAKEIMRNLGEEIYVDSGEEEITKFEFTLHRKA